MNFINSLIHGRTDFSPKMKALLQNFGNMQIASIVICRTQLPSFLSLTGNLLNYGKFKYDKLFHLFLKIRLVNNTNLILEKNQNLNMDLFKHKPNMDTMSIEIPPNLTINDMLEKTKEFMGDLFYRYKAEDNNCQFFVLNVLKANHILTKQEQDFIMQDVKYLFENKYIRKITNTLTDSGGRKDVVM